MKATGIVRRMDELGRVVIPKEIRRTLRIREGDPLEIFTDRDELMLKKYSPIATIEKFSESAAKSLAELSGKSAVVCDTDGVLFACGEGKRDFSGKTLSPEIDKLLKERKVTSLPKRTAERSFRSPFPAIRIFPRRSSCPSFRAEIASARWRFSIKRRVRAWKRMR